MKGSYKLLSKNSKKVWFFDKPYQGGRDIKLKLKSDDKEAIIKVRHTPAASGKPQQGVKVVLEYKGASALGGQVVGIPLFTKIIQTVDPSFAQKIRNEWNKNYKKYVDDANNYINFGGGKQLYADKSPKSQKKFNEDVGAISGLTVMNAIRPVLDKYFKTKGKVQDNVVRAVFAYVSSRSSSSSPFVIAKD